MKWSRLALAAHALTIDFSQAGPAGNLGSNTYTNGPISVSAFYLNGNNYTTVAAASMNFAPSDYGSGPMTFESSPARMHTIITYLEQTIGAWLVRLP